MQRGAAAHCLTSAHSSSLRAARLCPASRHHLPFLREASLHRPLFYIITPPLSTLSISIKTAVFLQLATQLLRIFSESSADTGCCSGYERKLSCSPLRFNFPRQPLLAPMFELILIKMNEIAHLFLHLEKSVWPATTVKGGLDAKLILYSESSGLQLQ